MNTHTYTYKFQTETNMFLKVKFYETSLPFEERTIEWRENEYQNNKITKPENNDTQQLNYYAKKQH